MGVHHGVMRKQQAALQCVVMILPQDLVCRVETMLAGSQDLAIWPGIVKKAAMQA